VGLRSLRLLGKLRIPKMSRIKRALSSRLPQSREVWLVSIGWHISAVFLFLTLWIFPSFPEISFLTLFIALYVHVVVNRRLAERKLKAHKLHEAETRAAAVESMRNELTIQLERKIGRESQDRANDSIITKKLLSKTVAETVAETYLVSSGISYLASEIRGQYPIWFERSWAASPAFLAHLYSTIREEKPSLVLDLGSGLTTLIASKALEKNGFGRVVAWEHSKKFQSQTTTLLKRHGDPENAVVLHKPLVRTRVDSEYFLWFDEKQGDEIHDEKIAVLIVDSPPGQTGRLARLPALPILLERLSTGAVIFLDDSDRPDEQEILGRWLKLVPKLEIQQFGASEKTSFAVIRMPQSK
jgi:hypothetical protein